MPPPRLLAVLTLGWAVAWLQRGALSPVGPLVQADLGVGYAELGLLPTLGVLAGALGYLAAGHWARRDPRPSMLLGAALLAAGALGSAFAPGYALLALAQGVGGVGEGLFYVPALALVTRAYPPPRSGRALGTLDAGISAGTVVVLAMAPAVVLLAGWRGVFLAAGLVGAAMVPLLAAAVRRGPPEPAPPALREVLTRRAAPLYAAVTLLLVVYFALIYLSPTFLVARGFTLPEADLLAALAVALGIPWHVAGGALADRWGAARVAMAFNALFAASLVALALAPSALLTGGALVVAYSVGIVGFVSLIALLPAVVGPARAAAGFGVFWAFGYLGGAAGPVAMGLVADAAGFGPAVMGLAALALLASAAVAPLRGTLPGPAGSAGEG